MYERVENKLSQVVPENEAVEEPTEALIQRILGKLIDHVPFANNTERIAMKAEVAKIFQTQEQTEAEAVSSGAAYPASYPNGGTPQELRTWYANATDDEIAQLNAANANPDAQTVTA